MICKDIFRYSQLKGQTFLFLWKLVSDEKKFNGSKNCCVQLTIQLNISHLLTLLNVKTVLIQAIQINISHLFALNLNVK